MLERLQSPGHSSSKPSSPFIGSPGGGRNGVSSPSSRPVSASYIRSPGSVPLPGMARANSSSLSVASPGGSPGVLLVRAPGSSVSSPLRARSPAMRSPAMASHAQVRAREDRCAW